MPETLRDVFLNADYNDDEIIIRTLNTVLEGNARDAPRLVYILHLVDLLKELLQEKERPKVASLIYETEQIKTFDDWTNALGIYDMPVEERNKDYSKLWMMCYLRMIWEAEFESRILYKRPEYATREALGEDGLAVFRDALANEDYVLTRQIPNR